MEATLVVSLLIALGLGMLVGLQRTWALHEIAGIRTFPLITVLGVLAAALGDVYGGWTVAAGLIAVVALMVQGNVMKMRETDGEQDVGMTTEVAALVMYGVGASLHAGWRTEAVVAAGALAVLLHAKEPLHQMTRALSDRDLRALTQFVLVALVVLPILPDREYGPYGVLNPFKIWLMVVLIVGISIAAWAAYRLLGARRGTALTGFLGGLISSTATTVSYSRRTRARPTQTRAAAFVILMASATVFARVIFEIGVVAGDFLMELAPPLLVMLAVMLVAAAVQWRAVGAEAGNPGDGTPGTEGASGGAPGTEAGAGVEDEPDGLADEAPSELRAAIAFGLLYALVLLAVAAARQHLGDAGLFTVAAISGLTDVDAITLSTAQLVKSGDLAAGTAWRAILVAGVSNLVFKGGTVVALGSKRLRKPVLVGFGVATVVAALLVWLWP